MKKINKEKFLSHDPEQYMTCSNSKGQIITFYEHPIYGEGREVIAIINDVCFYTDFYECNDFGNMSEYNPVLLDNGELIAEYENIN